MKRDLVAIVRAICVKVCAHVNACVRLLLMFIQARSSAQRKQMFQDLQTAEGTPPSQALQLLLDMIVRWSSTYAMLTRALKLKDVSFVFFDASILLILYSSLSMNLWTVSQIWRRMSRRQSASVS